MSKYSIGDFARKLGVTPDFLKYCEKHGLLKAEIAENGYCSFDFRQSAHVIEYLKLRNQGYTDREIRETLYAGNALDAMLRQTEERRADIQRKIRYQEELLRYYDEIQKISPYLKEEGNWQIFHTGGFYFLPHTVDDDFLENEKIYEKIGRWNECLPIVSSAMRIPVQALSADLGWKTTVCWGYSVFKAAAARLGLDVTDPVTYVHPQRTLVIYTGMQFSKPDPGLMTYASEILRKTGEEIADDMYYQVIAKTNEGEDRRWYGVLYVPLKRHSLPGAVIK